MERLLALLIGLTILTCSGSSYDVGTLEPDRQVVPRVHISGILPNHTFTVSDRPRFNIKVVNGTRFKRRVSLTCDLSYLVGPDEKFERIINLEPRQWKRVHFSGRRTNFRMKATCNLDRYPE